MQSHDKTLAMNGRAISALALAVVLAVWPHTAQAQSVRFGPPTIVDRFSLISTNSSLAGETGFTEDFSGCCTHPDTGDILVVMRGPNGLYGIQNYTPEGVYQTNIALTGFLDVEGICVFDPASNLFAVVEEGINEITVIGVTSNISSIAKSSGTTYAMGLGNLGNSGIEGIVWDASNSCFYAVKEYSPMAVYRTSITNGTATTAPLFDAQQALSGICTDLSDLHFISHEQRLLLLSDQSRVVLECDFLGNVLASNSIPLEQPEGISLSVDGTEMYAIGEPNEYARFELYAHPVSVTEGADIELPVILDTASSSTVSVDFLTFDETAEFGTDFTPAGGTVDFLPGATTAVVSIRALADSDLEGPQTFTVWLTNAVNAQLGSDTAYAVSIADPGEFRWDPIPATQHVGQAFDVVLTAVDTNGVTLSGFTNSAELGMIAVRSGTDLMSGTPAHSASRSRPISTRGLRFTPSTDIAVTHLLYYWGDTVSLWTDRGTLLTSLSVPDMGGEWGEVALSSPVNLQAGSSYRLASTRTNTLSNVRYYWVDRSFSYPFAHGRVDYGCQADGDAFPADFSLNYYLVDMRYTATWETPASMLPPLTGAFVSGVWSGTVTVTESVEQGRLRVDDGQGHASDSGSFAVIPDPPLTLHLPADAREGDGTISGTVSIPESPGSPLLVSLVSDDPSEATVPAGVVIDSGETAAVFDIEVQDDDIVDGTRPVTIRATATGYSEGSAAMRIKDNENPRGIMLQISKPSGADGLPAPPGGSTQV